MLASLQYFWKVYKVDSIQLYNLGEYVRSAYGATSYEIFVLRLALEWVISSNKHYEDAWIQTKAVLII